MQTARTYQDMSAVDALWTLYLQQSQPVRDAFRSRIAHEVKELQSYTEEEAKALTLKRGRAIKAGRVKQIPHEEVMQQMEQMLANYAD